jgi:hypothetical protein
VEFFSFSVVALCSSSFTFSSFNQKPVTVIESLDLISKSGKALITIFIFFSIIIFLFVIIHFIAAKIKREADILCPPLYGIK